MRSCGIPAMSDSSSSTWACRRVLGSWWSVPVMALTIAITIVRTAREDRHLHAHLTGYVGYADQVRWRLVPRIW